MARRFSTVALCFGASTVLGWTGCDSSPSAPRDSGADGTTLDADPEGAPAGDESAVSGEGPGWTPANVVNETNDNSDGDGTWEASASSTPAGNDADGASPFVPSTPLDGGPGDAAACIAGDPTTTACVDCCERQFPVGAVYFFGSVTECSSASPDSGDGHCGAAGCQADPDCSAFFHCIFGCP